MNRPVCVKITWTQTLDNRFARVGNYFTSLKASKDGDHKLGMAFTRPICMYVNVNFIPVKASKQTLLTFERRMITERCEQ